MSKVPSKGEMWGAAKGPESKKCFDSNRSPVAADRHRRGDEREEGWQVKKKGVRCEKAKQRTLNVKVNARRRLSLPVRL